MFVIPSGRPFENKIDPSGHHAPALESDTARPVDDNRNIDLRWIVSAELRTVFDVDAVAFAAEVPEKQRSFGFYDTPRVRINDHHRRILEIGIVTRIKPVQRTASAVDRQIGRLARTRPAEHRLCENV